MRASDASIARGCASIHAALLALRAHPSSTNETRLSASQKARESGRLSGRPRHRPSPDDVAVEMENTLPGIRPLVEDQPVSAAREPELLGDVTGCEPKATERFHIRWGPVVYPGHMLFGDDEHVRWGHRPKVPKSDHMFVLEHELRGRRSRNDVAKKA